jgi:TolB-like protein/tetratricopeptide (TPR) repeat protein
LIYRFDDFEIDTERFELRRGGAVQHVEPLVFDLIGFLSRNPGRIVSRDEIVEHVWNGRIVSDATVSGCVKSARKALGDSGDSQSLIETVRGRGFRFTADVATNEAGAQASPPAAAPKAQPVSDKPVLVVLPFENRSADVDAYFADGLTEDIITNLSRFRDLLVIGRSASFRFRDTGTDLSSFCASLDASYAVEGSVRRAGGRVRINAQLVDAATGVQLWGDVYDRDMEDIFAVQDEVTRTIAATLGVTIQDVALRNALRKSPDELRAYDCVLRARRFTSMLSAEAHAEARDLLERAVELDPSNADAHALLANVYLAEHRFGTNPRPDPIGRALTTAEAAVRLDPQNAYARCWLAFVYFFRKENDKFEAEARRALDLNPNDPETLADIGHFLAFMGESERGLELSLRAQELNPLHPGWYHFTAVRAHFAKHEYEAALTEVRHIAMPDFYWMHVFAAAILGQLGHSDAKEALKRVYELRPDFDALAELERWNTAPDDMEHILDGLRKAGLDEEASA